MSEEAKNNQEKTVENQEVTEDKPNAYEKSESVSEELNTAAWFVKGGTPTEKSQKYFENLYQDAEKRRSVDDKQKAISKIPWQQGGGVLQTHHLTDHPEIPKACLCFKYLTPFGEETGQECMVDLVLGGEGDPTELTLIIVCPKCLSHGQKHMQDCQLKISQRKKHFNFVAGMGESFFIFENDSGQLQKYPSAGMVTESEKFSCPDCGWTARIDHNRVWPDL